MTKLAKAEVLQIASLAKLNLSDSEVEKFGSQLSKVIEFIGHLKEVDVEAVEPTAQVTGLENVYREDKVKGEMVLAQDQALSGTDNIHNGYFKVDAILAERSDK